MSADLLRRAAARLREWAEAATPGPWVFDQTEVDGDEALVGREDATVYMAYADDNGTKFGPADGEYIALMHPGVGLVLADWLDAHAQIWERWPKTLDTTGDDPSPAAVAVARAILREVPDA